MANKPPPRTVGEEAGGGTSEFGDPVNLRGSGSFAFRNKAKLSVAPAKLPDAAVAGSDKAKRSTGTKIRSRGGVRTMKTYILTEGELSELGTLQFASSASFAVASVALGIWISITQAFAFTEKLAPVVQSTWGVWQDVSIWSAVGFAVLGVILVVRGYTRLNRIKSEMSHND